MKKIKKIKIEYENEENEENEGNEKNEENENKENLKKNENRKNEKNENEKKIIIINQENEDIENIKSISHELLYHQFNDNEIQEIRKSLLLWFDKNKRDLPWRNHDEGLDENIRAYRIWVSEIMLQQTKVITVIDYFNRWVKKWPTVKDLSMADLDQVNQMWSGLGYYRRAKNLFLGSKYIMENFKGVIPKDLKKLLEIPGIGAYTAGAISSIAFNMVEPLVDGNVIRVFSRLRSIGANPKNSKTVKFYWSLGKDLVDPNSPGDFNQSLMELGATLCSVQSPQCNKCPISNNCNAFKEVTQFNLNKSKTIKKNSILNFFEKKQTNNDVKDSSSNELKKEQDQQQVKKSIIDKNNLCTICENWEDTDSPTESVCKYPKKVIKVKPRLESLNVFLIHHKIENKFLLIQRPENGLLASLFEAPNVLDNIIENDCEDEEEEDDNEEEEDDDDDNEKKKKKKSNSKKRKSISNSTTKKDISTEFIQNEILNTLFLKKGSKSSTNIKIDSFKNIGTVIHKFSHITQTLNVYDCPCTFDSKNLPKSINSKNIKWIDLKNIKNEGLPKQMLKCFDLFK